jgi:regulator of RNase E activity RraA
MSASVAQLFCDLTTPQVADACLRMGVVVRCAPYDLRPLRRSDRFAGRVSPARHFGSVDVFLEALDGSRTGDVLVIDNRGRRDEACIGDLIALEAKAAGIAAIVVWGLHRDTPELIEIGLAVFSLGACPTGPLHLEERTPDALISAQVGSWIVDGDDLAIGDENGVVFVPVARAQEVAIAARTIRDTERAQAEKVRAGTSLRSQLKFQDFIAGRAVDPALTFRRHLRGIGGAVEE